MWLLRSELQINNFDSFHLDRLPRCMRSRNRPSSSVRPSFVVSSGHRHPAIEGLCSGKEPCCARAASVRHVKVGPHYRRWACWALSCKRRLLTYMGCAVLYAPSLITVANLAQRTSASWGRHSSWPSVDTPSLSARPIQFLVDVSAAIDQHANPCSIAQMQHAYAMRTILHHRANIQAISGRSIYSAGPALPGATVHC